MTDPAGRRRRGRVRLRLQRRHLAHHSDDPSPRRASAPGVRLRRYRQVTVHTGAAGTTRSKTVSSAVRAMHGDKRRRHHPLGHPRPAGLPVDGVASITDEYDQYTGTRHDHVTYNGATPITVGSTTRGRGDRTPARHRRRRPRGPLRPHGQVRRPHLPDHPRQTWRATRVHHHLDDHGMPVTVDDSGEVAKGGDQEDLRPHLVPPATPRPHRRPRLPHPYGRSVLLGGRHRA